MNFQTDFNPALSLWTSRRPGHTPATLALVTTHVIPQAACMLLTAAQLDQLSQLPTQNILTAIRAKQSAGQLCFYHEEEANHDNNASFFTGLPLALLWTHHREKLPPDAQTTLQAILTGLALWLSTKLGEDRSFYPNMYLGELLVVWLVAHAADDQPTLAQVLTRLDATIARYESDGWGWAEDLSDLYSKILADQLSTFAFLAPGLPASTREGTLRLLNHLLTIEDTFRPGPRVPALRSYAFLDSPRHPTLPRDQSIGSYRASVRAWAPDEQLTIRHVAAIGPLLARHGWHQAVTPPTPPPTRSPHAFTAKLHNQNHARALIFPDFRIGGVDRFPVMPSAEHHEWGLAWQSMPVALWHQSGDWGYLQWSVENPKGPVGHPALFSRQTDLGSIQKSLSPDLSPPIVGETFTLFTPTACFILRRMRTIPASWSQLTDHLRIVDLTAHPSAAADTLKLQYPARTLRVTHLNPWSSHPPTLRQSPTSLDFGPTLAQPALSRLRGYTALWIITFTDTPAPAPAITRAPHSDLLPRDPSETAFTLHWPCPLHPLTLTLDPLSTTPLTPGRPD